MSFSDDPRHLIGAAWHPLDAREHVTRLTRRNAPVAQPPARFAHRLVSRVTPHDLRHTAASLAVSAGANVKAVQRMLGHASAAMTLDTYSDLFDDDLDFASAALDRARAEVRARSMRTIDSGPTEPFHGVASSDTTRSI